MAIVFRLTPAMRRALDLAVKGRWAWVGSAQGRMASTLCLSGLLTRQGRSTAAGRLALSAKPDGRAWWFATPELATSRDVRRLRQCEVCRRPGMDLPRYSDTTAHGACLVKRYGWPAIVEMDDRQLARLTVDDFVFLGITLEDVDSARVAGAEEAR